MSGSDFRVVFTTALIGMTEIRLYNETIQKVIDGHPEIPAELPSIDHTVMSALTNPTHIEISYSNSYVFVDRGSTNKSGDPLRIPVKVITGTATGRVKTFYFAETPSAANVVWRSSDE